MGNGSSLEASKIVFLDINGKEEKVCTNSPILKLGRIYDIHKDKISKYDLVLVNALGL